MEFKNNKTLDKICPILPIQISKALCGIERSVYNSINELRLHSGGSVGVVIENKNYYLSPAGITADALFSLKTDERQFEDFLYKFCSGSVFIHEETIKDFYITIDGIRVGLSGKASIKSGKITGLSSITGLCIRLSRHIPNVSDELYKILMSDGFDNSAGVLIVSKPGVGKTTLLRDLCLKLSTKNDNYFPYRVCVVDERCEIYDKDLFSNSHCDFLLGVDKVFGIETASRLLSPQIIICDEISAYEQADKISRVKSHGIVFICSLHADTAESALFKEEIKKMFNEGIFKGIYELTRYGNGVKGKYTRYDKC